MAHGRASFSSSLFFVVAVAACGDGARSMSDYARPGAPGGDTPPRQGGDPGGGGDAATKMPGSSCVDSGAGPCVEPAPSWSCDGSSYQGAQYWTCNGGAIYRCESGAPMTVKCAAGCDVGPPGTQDACKVPGTKPVTPIPSFTISIQGGLFAEAAVRKPIEDGLAYEIARIAKNANVGTKKMPAFSLTFIPSSDSYASGLASVSHADIWVPNGYPLVGDNQNYVVNITLHEIGHLLAHHLIAPRELRGTCVNEGLASWIAGKYWMNAASQPVSSLRAAAHYDIARGAAYASMANCVSASDAWYKVYASFFEYLEQHTPGGIESVSSAKVSESTYVGAWSTWLWP